MEKIIYVAANGDDRAAGTELAPLRTPERAAALAEDCCRIVLRGGIYTLKNGITLRDVSDVTVEAYPGEAVTLTGALQVHFSDFTEVTDAALRAALPKTAMELDLKKLGLTEYGQFCARGFRRPYIPAQMELVMDGAPLRLSRYPKHGELTVESVIDPGSISMDVETPDFSDRGGTIGCADRRIFGWRHTDDILASGFFSCGYADDTIPVQSFCAEKSSFTLRSAVMFGVQKNEQTRYHFLNVLDELCEPGEYYIDRAEGRLYLIPPAGFGPEREILLTVCERPLVSLINTRRVTLRGLRLTASRGIGVYMEQGEENCIEKLRIESMGIVGAVIGKGVSPDRAYRHHFYKGVPASGELGSLNEHLYNDVLYDRSAGHGHRIRNCRICRCGAGGVSLGGGSRRTLEAGGNCVEDCVIFDCNRLDRSLKGLINIDGVGNVIRGCELSQATNMAICIHGNEHRIEYNDIHHTCTQTEDAGAIYIGRDPSEQGNVIRFNYIHDVQCAHRPRIPLKDGMGSFGVYNDDIACGTTVFGNVFYRAGTWAVHNNCCSDIRIENNIFVECQTAVVHGDRFWGVLRTDPLTREGGLIHDRLINQVRILQPPYSERYPNLTHFFENDGKPLRNSFCRNILYRCLNALETRHKDEWYINDTYLTGEGRTWKDVIAGYRGWYRQEGNLVLDEDPELEGRPFDLRTFQNAERLRLVPGFQRIPVEKIAGELTDE